MVVGLIAPHHQASATVVPSNVRPTTMPTKFWDDVAQCETNRNWKDKGNFAGGLGIALSTWGGYGGYEFAKTPDRATKEEQIIVAHRISIFGYQTKDQYRTLDDKLNNRPFFRPPVGFFGWGCIKHNEYLHPKIWKKNNQTKTRSIPRK